VLKQKKVKHKKTCTRRVTKWFKRRCTKTYKNIYKTYNKVTPCYTEYMYKVYYIHCWNVYLVKSVPTEHKLIMNSRRDIHCWNVYLVKSVSIKHRIITWHTLLKCIPSEKCTVNKVRMHIQTEQERKAPTINKLKNSFMTRCTTMYMV